MLDRVEKRKRERGKMKVGEILIFIIGVLLFVVIGCSFVSRASDVAEWKTWKDVYQGVKIGQKISTVIEACGEPTEILENANGALYLLSYGYYYQEGEDTDLSGCTIYAWKRLKNNGYSYVHQTQAMVYFVRESKIVFRYAHKLHTK